MMARIIIAVIFVPVFVFIIFLSNPIFYNLVVSIVLLVGLFEYYVILKRVKVHIINWLNVLFLLTVLYEIFNMLALETISKTIFYYIFYFIFCFGFYLILVMLISLFTRGIKDALMRMIFTIFGGLYIVILGSSIIIVREFGPYKTLLLFLIIWCYDSSAYLIGTAFGKHKIMPLVSPKKSIEGLIGGILVVSGVVIALKYTTNIIPFNSTLYTILAVIIICLFAQAGDLVESLLKRFCRVKDSSRIIPGHGGILDKIDSFLTATPVYLLLLTI